MFIFYEIVVHYISGFRRSSVKPAHLIFKDETDLNREEKIGNLLYLITTNDFEILKCFTTNE